MLHLEFFFLASEKQFFPFARYSWPWKQFFRQADRYFFKEFFILASDNGLSVF